MEICIRHSEADDYAAVKAIYEQPSCYGNTLQLPYPADITWQNRLLEKGPNRFSLVAELEGKIVGQIGMDVCDNHRRKHVSNFGMGVLEEFQGKGIGSQLLSAMMELAVNWLAIKRIELEVFTDNEPGRALYLKHGFVQEGIARNYALKDGKYADVYLMAKIFP